MNYKRTLVSALCWNLLLSCVHADDWPQWQGPDRNAISKEAGLLKEWPKEGPPLAWKVQGLGGGYSAPAVAAGRIFGMSNRGDEEVVWARSEKDGKELWTTPLGPAGQQGPPQGKEGPGCTPTVDGERLYALGLRGNLYRLPDEYVLALTTMCGHGLISSNFAKKMIDLVKEKRLTAEKGACYMAKFCRCGAFNVSRAIHILRDAKTSAGI